MTRENTILATFFWLQLTYAEHCKMFNAVSLLLHYNGSAASGTLFESTHTSNCEVCHQWQQFIGKEGWKMPFF